MEKVTAPKEKNCRDSSFDNVRFILIFLVVFGHLLEFAPIKNTELRWDVYRLIYSFHMPLFMFISGYFAKFDPSKVIKRLVLPYAAFQLLYQAFDMHLLDTHSVKEYGFAKPYWILWYMLALIMYTVLLPMFDVKSTAHRGIAIIAAFGVSFLAGFDEDVGYVATLSRFFVFQPYFLMGYYWKKEGGLTPPAKKGRLRSIILGICATALASVSLIKVWNTEYKHATLYGSYPYRSSQPWESRVELMVVAVAVILFTALVLLPLLRRRIPVISAIGENTLSVFLLHGFVMKWCRQEKYEFLKNPWYLLLFTLTLLLVFGNPLVGRAVRYVFCGGIADSIVKLKNRVFGKQKKYLRESQKSLDKRETVCYNITVPNHWGIV